MAIADPVGAESSDREFLITRVFDAPRERVFNAWIDSAIVKRWSAPRGFAITYGSAELHPGGAWRCCMRSPEGVDLWLGGTYRDIAGPQRLVFTHAWDDQDGKPGPETLVTVDLEAGPGKTVMRFHQQGFESRESRDGHHDGWNDCFDRLAEVLASA